MEFDYQTTPQALLTPDIVNTVSLIHEYRGRQVRLSRVRPEVLSSLCEIAKIQSTGASNRIENISTSEQRLHELMVDNGAPRDRNEREILGYRYVLDLIHENHDDIPVTPGVILQFHRDLYRYLGVAFGGHWKDSDNIIQEVGPDGSRRTRFVPVSALETPASVEALCAAYREAIAAGVYDPLLLVALFAFDFVCIHPFNDGNGRMSRLLTLLLLYRNGFTVGKYISIEHEIERTKESYYETLKESSYGWHEGACDYRPFVSYLLGVVLACYRALDERSELIDGNQTNEERVRGMLEAHLGSYSKRELRERLPMMSESTLTRILQALQEEGVVERVGSARSTAYRWKR